MEIFLTPKLEGWSETHTTSASKVMEDSFRTGRAIIKCYAIIVHPLRLKYFETELL